MELNGVPLHPLVIHAAVVFTPLAALAVIAFFVLRTRRAALRLPTLALAAISGLSVVAAYFTGENLFDSNDFYRTKQATLEHQEWGERMLWVGIAFAVVSIIAVASAQAPKPGGGSGTTAAVKAPALGTALGVLAVLLSVAAIVVVVITGDLGARSVWGGS